MSFAVLALIGAAALLGPALARPDHWRAPVVVGELLAGVVLGRSGLRWVPVTDPTLEFLAQAGFAVVMFVVGSHVPLRDPRLRPALRTGLARAVLVGLLAVPAGWLIAATFHTGHGGLYTVLLASSSAALILPIVDSARLGGDAILALLPQVALADTAGIVALPLVIDPAHAGRAALGAGLVVVAAGALWLVLRHLDRTGVRRRLHRLSESRKFALELRIDLVLLFALAGLAVWAHVPVLLAGFAFGLVVAAIGTPRRLARQLFALSDGFLGPIFFVWLGASLDLSELARHPSYVVLGLVLGLTAVAVHVALRIVGQPLALGALAAAQLGVPVAAAALGTATGLVTSGEAAALILGALVTVAMAAGAGGFAARTVHSGTT